MGIDLPLIWAGIIVFGLMMYVVMDGFDLGIGILFPFIPGRDDRDVMVNTVAPVWDGNETWLVLGGAGLLAAFPQAYATILSALYLPLMLMLAGLIWRGVAFEFRFKADEHHKPFWDKAFTWGSYIATLAQGMALGGFIGGFELSESGSFAGGALDWLTPFSVFTGVSLVIAYALLGATWLVMKTEGPLQAQMRRLARGMTIALIAAIALVSVWTPLAHEDVAARWFVLPNLLFFLPVPILVGVTAWGLLSATHGQSHSAPFLLALMLLFLGYSGLGISLWPMIIPPDITIWQAAAPPQSMGFALVGALFIIPFILMYTAWSYYVFRGKVKSGDGYH